MPSIAQRLGLSKKRKSQSDPKPIDIKSEADAIVERFDRLLRRAVGQVLKTGDMDAMNAALGAMQKISEISESMQNLSPEEWIKFARLDGSNR